MAEVSMEMKNSNRRRNSEYKHYCYYKFRGCIKFVFTITASNTFNKYHENNGSKIQRNITEIFPQKNDPTSISIFP